VQRENKFYFISKDVRPLKIECWYFGDGDLTGALHVEIRVALPRCQRLSLRTRRTGMVAISVPAYRAVARTFFPIEAKETLAQMAEVRGPRGQERGVLLGEVTSSPLLTG